LLAELLARAGVRAAGTLKETQNDEPKTQSKKEIDRCPLRSAFCILRSAFGVHPTGIGMKRVLYIGAGNPWSGGAGFLVRQDLFLRALAEVADLHLAMFDADPANPPAFACPMTSLPSPPRRSASKIQRLWDDLLSPQPRMIRGYDLAPARAAVASLDPDGFDAVFAYRIDFAHFAGVLNHPRLLLDIDDAEHLRWQRRILTTTGHDGDWRTRGDLLKLRDFEVNAVAGAKLAFVCQENDQNGWATAPQIVPNCVDLPTNPQRRPTRPRLLFVGNCAGGPTSPNVDAVRYFLADIWPIILKAVPDAEFQIIGNVSESVRAAAAGVRNVQLSGFVPDLTDAYAQASISIAPIRFGTGTRVKILEAFAHACPVVSTLPGAEGIAAVPGQEIEFGLDAKDFAARCIELLNDRATAERLGQAAHALAARFYDRKVQHHRVAKILTDFLSDGDPTG
jgi:glycosyltransferase involved in cell wall biosynthesis